MIDAERIRLFRLATVVDRSVVELLDITAAILPRYPEA